MDLFFIFCAKYLFILPALILGGYFFTRSRQSKVRMVLFAVPAALLAYALGTIANHLFIDVRPFVGGHFTPLVYHVADNGFPSDHTLFVAALAVIGTLWNWKLGLVLWIITILVAVARVYVGLHHSIDVIGSILISTVAVLGVYSIFHHAYHKEII